MYGHADRIDGQDKGSGKLPVLLDYFLKGAYNWEMTTSDNAQRDELADEIAGHSIGDGYYSAIVHMDEAREIADDILAAGYRKPRTITTVEELDALPVGSQLIDSDPSLCQKIEQGWVLPGGDEVFKNVDITLPATVLREPKTEAGA